MGKTAVFDLYPGPGQTWRIPATANQHYQIVDVDRIILKGNVTAIQKGDGLILKYGDGSVVVIEGFYSICKDAQCKLSLSTEAGNEYIIPGGHTTGEALPDGGIVLFHTKDGQSPISIVDPDIQGDSQTTHTQQFNLVNDQALMAMVQANSASLQYPGNGMPLDSGTSLSNFFTLAEGSYLANAIQVRQTDKAGNLSTAVGKYTQTLTVDQTAPAAPTLALAADTGSSSSDHITSNGRINVGGLESGATWQYSINGGTTWTAGTDNFFTLAEGSYLANAIQVRQTDKAGNLSTAVGKYTQTLTVDQTAPAAPTLALAADTGSSSSDHITSNGRINVGGLESGATWQYSINGGTTWTAGTDNFFTLAEGSYLANAIQVRQTDKAGNLSTAVGKYTQTLTVDQTAPAAPTLALAADTGSSSSDHITSNGRINVGGLESGATWQYSINGGTTWTAGTDNFFTLAEGSYLANAIQVRQTDKAGNLSTAVGKYTQTLTVDQTAPAAPTLALAADTGSSSSDHITSNGRINVGGLESGATWQYSINGGTTWTAGTDNFFTLAEGSYLANAIQVRQTDKAGNLSTAVGKYTQTLTVDQTAPAAPTLALAADTGSSSSDHITSNGRINVGGLESGATWQYSINGGTTWTAGTDNFFTLAEGSYLANAIQVRQTDKAGNLSTAVGKYTQTLTVDQTAPAAPTLALAADTGSSSSDHITSNGRINVGGLESGATWQYSINGGTTWTAGTDNFFTLAEGSYLANAIQVRQTDKAGNLSTAVGKYTQTLTVDQTAPAAPTLALAADTGSSSSDHITSNGRINVGGLESGATWQYSINGGTTWTAGTDNFFTLAEGSYLANAIQVRQTDKAGNLSTAVGKYTQTLTVDQTAPVLDLNDVDASSGDGSAAVGAAPLSAGVPLFTGMARATDNVQLQRPVAISKLIDGDSRALGGANSITTVVIDGKTYAVVAARVDNGVQIIDISDPSSPQAITAITDGQSGTFTELKGASYITTVVIDGKTYALVAAFGDNGVQIINISDPASPQATASISNNQGFFNKLADPWGITTVVIGDKTYALVAARDDHSVQIMDISDPANPVYTSYFSRGMGGGFDVMERATDITTVVIDGKTYALVAALGDNGVQIIDISNPASPKATASITDQNGGFTELNGAAFITTVVIDGKTYALVAALGDNGVQIIDISDPTSPKATAAITDGQGGFTELNGAWGITTVVIGGKTYALVTGFRDDGVQIIDISDPTSPQATDAITDEQDGFNTLKGAISITTVTIGGKLYGVIAAYGDSGVQIIELPVAPSIASIAIGVTGLDATHEVLRYGQDDADVLAIGGMDASKNSVSVAGVSGLDLVWDNTSKQVIITRADGSALTTIQAEAIIAALSYQNTNSRVATGDRTFRFVLTDTAENTSEAAEHTVTVDTTAPVLGTVTITSDAGTDQTYKPGDAIEITVTFSDKMVVDSSGGTPQISIEVGSVTRQAQYVSGSGTKTLVFRYTVGNDKDADGVVINQNGLALNGGMITDQAGNALASLDHAAVAASAEHKVDSSAGIASAAVEGGSHIVGDTVTIILRATDDETGLTLAQDKNTFNGQAPIRFVDNNDGTYIVTYLVAAGDANIVANGKVTTELAFTNSKGEEGAALRQITLTDSQSITGILRIAAIGDSITQGSKIAKEKDFYPVQLGKLLGAAFDVQNFGRGNAKVLKEGGGKRPYWNGYEYKQAKDFNPHMVISNLGINDFGAVRNNRDDFVSDYKSILSGFTTATDFLIWTSLLPIIPPKGNGYPDNLKSTFITLLTRIAREIEAGGIDIRTPFVSDSRYDGTHARNNPLVVRDGLHPSAAGALLIAQITYAAVLEYLKARMSWADNADGGQLAANTDTSSSAVLLGMVQVQDKTHTYEVLGTDAAMFRVTADGELYLKQDAALTAGERYRITLRVKDTDGGVVGSSTHTLVVLESGDTKFTGAPEITLQDSDTPTTGSVLIASIAKLDDTDGEVVVGSWQWQRGVPDSSTGNIIWRDIPEATEARYALVADDVGYKVRVVAVSGGSADAEDSMAAFSRLVSSNVFIMGGSSDDTLTSGAENDMLTGGAGSDTFVFVKDHGHDKILDFDSAHDRIDLSALAEFKNLAAVQAATQDVSGSAVITTSADHTITLANITKSSLQTDDFVFSGAVL